jgi:hypothetical protein
MIKDLESKLEEERAFSPLTKDVKLKFIEELRLSEAMEATLKEELRLPRGT